jgi:hypothetical protein
MHDKLARRQADHSALLNLSLVPSLRLRRYRFQHGLDGGTVRYVVTVLRCQPNLILPLRCSISLVYLLLHSRQYRPPFRRSLTPQCEHLPLRNVGG